MFLQFLGKLFGFTESYGGIYVVAAVLTHHAHVVCRQEAVMLIAMVCEVIVCKTYGRIIADIDVALVKGLRQKQSMAGA